jgi:hypothetical protein
MPSRRRRKRCRGPASAAGARGDRPRPQPEKPDSPEPAVGARGLLCGEWETASRSDLLLLCKAMMKRWPIPPERRRPIMDAVTSQIYREDTPVRLTLAIARLVIAAGTRDLEEALTEGRQTAPSPLPEPATPRDIAEPGPPLGRPRLPRRSACGARKGRRAVRQTRRRHSRDPPPGRRPPRPRRTPQRPWKARGRSRGRTTRTRPPPGRPRLPRRPCIVPWAISRSCVPSASPPTRLTPPAPRGTLAAWTPNRIPSAFSPGEGGAARRDGAADSASLAPRGSASGPGGTPRLGGWRRRPGRGSSEGRDTPLQLRSLRSWRFPRKSLMMPRFWGGGCWVPSTPASIIRFT